MRKLSKDEKAIWKRVTDTVARPGVSAPTLVPIAPVLAPPARVWVLDLHGLKVMEAFEKTKSILDEAKAADARSVLIITGRSGTIRKEFPEWISNYRYELLNGGGAFRVAIPRKQPKKKAQSKSPNDKLAN